MPASARSCSRSWARPRRRPATRPGAARLALAAEGAQSRGERAHTLERLGGALWLLGQDATAAEAFERALDLAEAGGDHAQAARLRAGLLLAARFDSELRVRTIERLAPSLREPGFGRQRDPALIASVAFERALAGRRSVRVADLAERALEGVLADLDAVPGPECYAACCALLWSDSLATAEIALTMALEAARRRGNSAAAATISALPRLDRAAARPDRPRRRRRPRGERPRRATGPPRRIPGAATILAEIDMEQGRLDEAALTLEDPAQQTDLGRRSAPRLPPGGPRPAPPPARRPRGGPRGAAGERPPAGVARGAQPGGAAVALARGDRRRRDGRRRAGHDPRRPRRSRSRARSAPRGRSAWRCAPPRWWARPTSAWSGLREAVEVPRALARRPRPCACADRPRHRAAPGGQAARGPRAAAGRHGPGPALRGLGARGARDARS